MAKVVASGDAQLVNDAVKAISLNPLQTLASEGYVEALRMLCEAQIYDVDDLCSTTQTALCCALQEYPPQIACAEFLIMHKADVNHPGGEGSNCTALMKASEQGDVESVALLLKHRADPNLAHPELPHGLPLLFATHQDQYRLIALLVEAKADPDREYIDFMSDKRPSRSNDGTALWIACRFGKFRAAFELLKAGASTEKINANGTSALYGTRSS